MLYEVITIIKCCCDDPDCIESGISFDYSDKILFFHFLEIDYRGKLTQTTKSMKLDKSNTKQLIKQLKDLKF